MNRFGLYLVTTLSYLGLGCVLPIVLYISSLAKDNMKDTFSLLSGILLYALFCFLSLPNAIKNYSLSYISIAVISISSSIFLLLKSIECKKNDLWLSAWILLTVIMMSLPVFVSAKFLLPALPAISLVFVKHEKRLLAWALIVSAIGLSASVADTAFADSYRTAAEEFSRTEHEKTFFAGHWGFQYYMEKEGYTQIENNQITEKGTKIIYPFYPDSQILNQNLDYGKTDIILQDNFPIKIMDCEASIGFYSNHVCGHNHMKRNVTALLPFGLSFSPTEIIELLVVQ
ncbi:MAG: hypothetical protein HGA85_06120, partial [Nanoarchaeota archaeon]|nr:hypothetical protein [Nanoarchaeota archaeon]